MATVQEVIAGNLKILVQESARLATLYTKYVAARDRKRSWVLVGGLGISGTQQVWQEEAHVVHQAMPGFLDAPEQSSACGYGTPEFQKLNQLER